MPSRTPSREEFKVQGDKVTHMPTGKSYAAYPGGAEIAKENMADVHDMTRGATSPNLCLIFWGIENWPSVRLPFLCQTHSVFTELLKVAGMDEFCDFVFNEPFLQLVGIRPVARH
jgi:hypothetical protein